MKLPDCAQLIEHGFDWMTATATDRESGRELLRVGHRILKDARAAGDDVRVFRWKGYEGWCVEGCDVAHRYDSAMVRVHGRLANEEWWELYQVAQNITRIDLQLTYRLSSESVDHALGRAWKAVRRAKLYGKAVQWHYRRDSARGNTLEFGRRPSERFGRMYDKGLETRLDHYQNCIRLEAEFKGDVAWATLNHIVNAEIPAMAAAGHCHRFFVDRGVAPAPLPVQVAPMVAPQLERDVDRYCQWLTRCVRSGVQDVVAQRGVGAVLDALGLAQLVQPSADMRHVVQPSIEGGKDNGSVSRNRHRIVDWPDA